MKETTLSIIINKPCADVFLFTLTPTNTPLWIREIVEETVSAWPPKEGTVYKNRRVNGLWSSYTLSVFIEGQEFRLTSEDGNLNVHYRFTALGADVTKLEYYVGVDRGELGQPVEMSILTRLKEIMENS